TGQLSVARPPEASQVALHRALTPNLAARLVDLTGHYTPYVRGFHHHNHAIQYAQDLAGFVPPKGPDCLQSPLLVQYAVRRIKFVPCDVTWALPPTAHTVWV